MIDFVRFDNHLPRCALVLGLDNEPPFNDVVPVTPRIPKHGTQLNLVEIAVLHALLKMRSELELPLPPVGPAHARTSALDRTLPSCCSLTAHRTFRQRFPRCHRALSRFPRCRRC